VIETLGSITDTSVEFPQLDQLIRVFTLRDLNTRVVVLGVTVLGIAAGTIGAFLLLRRRSLTADALSHATLPGIAVAFLVMVALGGDGKSLPGLLVGASVFGVLAMGCILLIRHTTPLRDDAALGIVLSVFFGLGLCLLSLIQELSVGNAAGLDRFIFGKAASMLPGEAWSMLVTAIIVTAACAVLFKEFRILCFDQDFAQAQGWPIVTLDALLMVLVVAVTVIALQSVGLVLAVALLIVPAASARFWTDRLGWMVAGSAIIGAVSGYLGASLSALLPRLPTGPVIVLVCTAVFIISLMVGRQRGLLLRLIERSRIERRIGHQHLLRAMYEVSESDSSVQGAESMASISRKALSEARAWSRSHLQRLLASARRAGLVEIVSPEYVGFTEAGRVEAARVVRNHRLWETYLINYADVAPSHVDRSADEIEHVLGTELVERLEQLLAQRVSPVAVPPSPHMLEPTR
jgi:manganese/zinc/iron transport system permease protein